MTQCTYIHRHLQLTLKIPSVIKKVVGPATKKIIIEERIKFDPVKQILLAQCNNPRMKKLLLIHETRSFTASHDDEHHESTTILACRFRVILLPTCGLLSSTLYKWLSLTWKQKQQEMGERIAKRLEYQRRHSNKYYYYYQQQQPQQQQQQLQRQQQSQQLLSLQQHQLYDNNNKNRTIDHANHITSPRTIKEQRRGHQREDSNIPHVTHPVV